VRLTLCSDACDMGGAERYLLDLAEDVAATHDVRVVLSDCQQTGALRTQLLSRGVGNVRHLPSGTYPRRRAPGIYREARKAFAEGDGEVLHFSLHHADSCRYWIAAAASLAVPYVITEHAVSPGFLRASRLTHRMKRHAYRRAGHVIFVGENARREVELDLGILPNASVVHPGISTEGIRRGANTSDVIFLGRWSEQKNPVVAVRAYVEASRDVPEATLSVFGAGPLEAELVRVCEEASQGRVRLVGWSAQPADDLTRAGVFLQTSRWENSPYAILDAMASGVTVVAYAVGDVASILDFGNAGLPVAANDFDGLVRALRLAMSDKALRSRFAEVAPERVRSVYSRAEMVSRTLAVYRDLLG
jgi:glycosyltransferase involved in cell wall biosynthesis